jgi:hypothetical protein
MPIFATGDARIAGSHLFEQRMRAGAIRIGALGALGNQDCRIESDGTRFCGCIHLLEIPCAEGFLSRAFRIEGF